MQVRKALAADRPRGGPQLREADAMEWTKILENTVYLLALLNPASKVLFLSTYEPSLTSKQVFELSWKSSLAALGILVSFAIIGQFVLKDIFRIDMYSLKITGGFVLFFVGWTAVIRAVFSESASMTCAKTSTSFRSCRWPRR